MSIVLFEDERVAQLDPAALGKPAFAISCGSYRLADLAVMLAGPVGVRVRPHLAEIVAADYADFRAGDGDGRSATLWVNARAVPSMDTLQTLRSLLAAGKPGIVASGESIAAALLPAGSKGPADATILPTAEGFKQLGLGMLEAQIALFEFPHDIIRHHLTTLNANLQQRIATGGYQQLADGVFAAPAPRWVSTWLPIRRPDRFVLEAGATIGPHCYLSGPVHVGRAARVLEHAALKDGVAIGPYGQDRRRSRGLDHRSRTRTNSTTVSWDTATWEAGSTWAPAPATAI